MPLVDSSRSKPKSNGTSHNGSSAGSCHTDRLNNRSVETSVGGRGVDSLGVLEGFLTANTFGRVEAQHLGEQVEGQSGRVGVKSLELHSGLDRQ